MRRIPAARRTLDGPKHGQRGGVSGAKGVFLRKVVWITHFVQKKEV